MLEIAWHACLPAPHHRPMVAIPLHPHNSEKQPLCKKRRHVRTCRATMPGQGSLHHAVTCAQLFIINDGLSVPDCAAVIMEGIITE